MARINFSSIGDTPFQKLLGYNNDILNAWNNLGNVLLEANSLDSNLKEHVRGTLAYENQCEY